MSLKHVRINARRGFDDAAFAAMVVHRQSTPRTPMRCVAKQLRCGLSTCQLWARRGVRPSEWRETRRNPRPQPTATRQRIAARRAVVLSLASTFTDKVGVPGPRGGVKSSIEVHRRRHASTADLRVALVGTANTRVSRATIRRDLLQLGFSCRRRQRTARMWSGDKAARVAFAKQHEHTDWKRWIFSDETNAKIDDNGTCLTEWVRKGERPCPRELEQYPIRFHVWAAIGVGGWRQMKFLERTVNGECYEVECLQPVLDRLVRRRVIFVQDGAAAHRARREWLEVRGVEVAAWPCHSPDLNPIENLWAMVGRRVAARCPLDLASFREVWKQEFFAIPNDEIDRLLESFPARLRKCVASKGNAVTGPFH